MLIAHLPISLHRHSAQNHPTRPHHRPPGSREKASITARAKGAPTRLDPSNANMALSKSFACFPPVQFHDIQNSRVQLPPLLDWPLSNRSSSPSPLGETLPPVPLHHADALSCLAFCHALPIAMRQVTLAPFFFSFSSSSTA